MRRTQRRPVEAQSLIGFPSSRAPKGEGDDMSYFDQEFMGFFEGLAAENSKAYFDKRRKVYERSVRDPFKELVADLILRMREHEPELAIEPKDAIFRINRDIRFSKDKSPYKTHVSAHISRGGRKDHQYPGTYFHLNHEGGMIGRGVYMPDREGLQRIRTRIANNLDEFAGLVVDPAFKRTFGTIQGDAHKRIPKEFQAAHEVQPLIAKKQYYFMANVEAAEVVSDDLADVLMDHYLVGKPLAEFLSTSLR